MNAPLIVIVGETASGKSAVALKLAERVGKHGNSFQGGPGGEIICADSRTVYTGMDIGTAKPEPQEQQRVRHHCLNIITPDIQFTVSDFKDAAERAIEDIRSRGKFPIMVGGTGLYVDAVLYGFGFREPASPELRKELQGLGVDELQERLLDMGLPLPANSRNPRHLIRAIETNGQQSVRGPLRENTLIFGIEQDREKARFRIAARVEGMIAAGLEHEARTLSEKYGWEAPGLQTIGYREWRPYIEGNASLQDTQELIIRSTVLYAKRQRTWNRRNNSIQWFSNGDDIINAVVSHTTLMNK